MNQPPRGAVTFLFSDIEGSTRLWEAHPGPMRGALARHDALMRDAIERAGGYVFKTIGDAFCAAFADAADALDAVIAAQRALQAEPWPDETPVRVRMALHTGEVESRDRDYFGPPVNRVARLLAIGHGGQSLLSQATRDQLGESLPAEVSLREMGAHKLKDLARPEQVFQLQHPALPAEFPTLRSLSTHPNRLPQQVTRFIGREREAEQVQTLLREHRLVTLTGAGGTGKTRLSLQVAADALERYPDGAWFVELAPLSDPSLVARTAADVLGVKEQADRPVEETLADALQDKALLIVLDNCEHVLDAAARLVHALLRRCEKVRILASTREPLGIVGEQIYRVPSLSLSESARLFLDRAALVYPDFDLPTESASALASICQRLDGIPLAIELAAARVRSLTVEEIDARLDQRFRLLTGGARTELPRQQTLRALIDWSWDLLNEAEKALLARLSVFVGGWMLEAAEAVCADDPIEDWQVLDLLTALVDKSLVVVDPEEPGMRYRLLETVRQYATERLAESGGDALWRSRHVAHFQERFADANEQLRGADQQKWLAWISVEHDNLRAALDAAPRGGLDLAVSIWRFWYVRGYLAEGRERLALALAADPGAEPALRAWALNGSGLLAWNQGDLAGARSLHEAALALRREVGDPARIANSLNNLGLVQNDLGEYGSARAHFEEGLAIQRAIGDPWGVASTLTNLSNTVHNQGDHAAACLLQEESLTNFRAVGDQWGIANALNNLGRTLFDMGDYPRARELHQESLEIRRSLGDRRGVSMSLNNLGNVAAALGDPLAARALFEESLALRREVGDRWGIASSFYNLGGVALTLGDHAAARALYRDSLSEFLEAGDRFRVSHSLDGIANVLDARGESMAAARLWAAAERLRDEIGAPLPREERLRKDRTVAAARAKRADPSAFDDAWAEGAGLTQGQAVRLALDA